MKQIYKIYKEANCSYPFQPTGVCEKTALVKTNIHTMLIAKIQYNICVVKVMQFIQGNNRHQTYFATLDDQVAPDNAVRLMDAFIDKLDLQKLGFTNTVHKAEGRPPFAPAVLLKLYLYGYCKLPQSSFI
jgi:transposase